MLEFTWPYSVRMLPNTKRCKLFCIFCGQKPPAIRDVITSRPFTSYLLQISEDISAHRNCLTCATDLEVEPGKGAFIIQVSLAIRVGYVPDKS